MTLFPFPLVKQTNKQTRDNFGLKVSLLEQGKRCSRKGSWYFTMSDVTNDTSPLPTTFFFIIIIFHLEALEVDRGLFLGSALLKKKNVEAHLSVQESTCAGGAGWNKPLFVLCSAALLLNKQQRFFPAQGRSCELFSLVSTPRQGREGCTVRCPGQQCSCVVTFPWVSNFFRARSALSALRRKALPCLS